MIFVWFFKLLSTFQVVYNVYSVVRNERKCVCATKLQKLLWKGSGKQMVAKAPAFRAGGASDGQGPGKAAVGPVRPQGLAQSCGTAGLTEPSGPPLCQSPELPSPPQPRRKTGSVTHGVGGGGTRSEFLASVKWPVWCQGRVSRGWPGQAKDWVRNGSGIGSALRCLGRNLNMTDFLLPAGGLCAAAPLSRAGSPAARGQGDLSAGPCRAGSCYRRWSTASHTSPAPSATASLCASWPSAPAPEPSSCILSIPPAPSRRGPGRGRGPGLGGIQTKASCR